MDTISAIDQLEAFFFEQGTEVSKSCLNWIARVRMETRKMSASVIESGQSSKIKMNKLAIALLVRRFGRCGGMESYAVWHLADKLGISAQQST